ncbi:bifunctional GNAT family N-acetyltransferase/acetate--CoA ligase family protein [Streptomyces sp. NBC_00390]|uniref:bifunctional acetate--CoA ligase family protein/GNAT family N-acetyltransferase n=1 Tax=Streptomyces sp. NBC_00390 TaxID=2975736 RepID=UPI002E23717D
MTETVNASQQVHALLTDGSTVRIRPVLPGDHERVLRLYDGVSTENLRLRFFTANRNSARQSADRLCAPATPGRRALLAESGDELVGVAEYDTLPGTGTEAEVGLAVSDHWHHRRAGTLLLEHLVSLARADGIIQFCAEALAENHAMLKVFADLGLQTTRHFDGPEVHCTVRLAEDETYLSAVDLRGRTADVASLRPLLRPRSVAVIGPGRHPGSVGRAVLRKLRHGGFTGRLFAVHPHAPVVLGTPTYPNVQALPLTPDLAVLAVRASAVPLAAEECGKRGVRGLLVVSSGLDARQAGALRSACRWYGMRLVGPNCLGIANTDRSVGLDATFAADPPEPGSAGVAVQSGGVGIALLGGLSRLGIGVSTFVSLGDKYDVSGNDLLQWWECDDRTDLALLHLESFGNPRTFSRTARRVTRRMPVLTVDAGRTDAGRRAAASHTAAAATSTMTRQALFTQAGITATRSIAELLETAALLHAQPLPGGRRIAVVSNAGGTGVLAADACAEAGLTVPPLPSAVTAALLTELPHGAVADNPIDTTAAVSEDQLRACLSVLSAAEEVDAVLVSLVPTAVAAATGDRLPRAVTCLPRDLACPIVAVLPDQEASVRLLPAESGSIPAYADPQAAAHALAHAVSRAKWLSRDAGRIPPLEGIHSARAAGIAAAYLSAHPEGGWLEPRDGAALLDCYGIPRLPWGWAENEDEAVREAERLSGPDGPVVLKAYVPGMIHKTEQHAVRLDLRGDAQIRAAHRDFVTRFHGRLAGVLVQPLAEGGLELLAGVVQDDVFGPLVLFGLGGTATEVLADHAARLAPLTDQDVHDLISAPRCAPLLLGHRGAKPVDVGCLEQLLLRLSRLAGDLPELAEADFNPVIAGPDGAAVADVRIRLTPSRTYDAYLRRLR